MGALNFSTSPLPAWVLKVVVFLLESQLWPPGDSSPSEPLGPGASPLPGFLLSLAWGASSSLVSSLNPVFSFVNRPFVTLPSRRVLTHMEAKGGV